MDDSLCQTTDAIWTFMREQLIGWVERSPERHERYLAVVRARAEQTGTAA